MQTIYNGIQYLTSSVAQCKKVLLVCDSSYPFLNIKQQVDSILHDAIIFNDFTSNPLYEDVCKGVSLFNDNKCDTIVAVGGGSAMDVAKCIKLFCKMSPDKLFIEQPYQDTNVRLIAIPTTAGTGSESTRYAVIYYDGKKQSITHDSIIPNVAILEPSVLKSLPVYQKKCTMLDALCQGIESWWSVNSTDKSKIISQKAVEIILSNWKSYIFDNDEEAASQIMKAANLAGQAICITQTTAAHAFSYKITSIYGLPHGHAVAVCLHHIWSYMLANPDLCIDLRGKDYLQKTFLGIAHAFGCESVDDAIMFFRQMLVDMQITQPSSSNMENDLVVLSSSVNPIRLKNNPVNLDDNAIKTLYKSILSSRS